MFENIWVEKYRPKTLDEIVLSEDVRNYFEQVRDKQELPNHVCFCSPPGSGKTSLAKIIAQDILDVTYLYINASDERGIDTIRLKVTNFAQLKSIDGKIKIIILDEMDGLTGEAQRALRNTMEEYADNVRFILTANYRNRITSPVMSRVVFFEMIPPLEESIIYCIEILKKEGIKVNGEKEKLLSLVKMCYPDVRKAINTISKFIKDGVLKITENQVEKEFIQKVFAKVIDTKIKIVDLRKFIIENETEFGGDYRNLIEGIFNQFCECNLSEDKKREVLVILGEGLYRNCFALDYEINAYCTLIKVRTNLIST